MVCPNCKSNDIVAIQGQHYCLNCGQLVPESAATKPIAPPVSPDLAAKIAGTPLKIIGNTPAPVADKPKPVTTPKSQATTPAAPLAIKVITRNRLGLPAKNTGSTQPKVEKKILEPAGIKAVPSTVTPPTTKPLPVIIKPTDAKSVPVTKAAPPSATPNVVAHSVTKSVASVDSVRPKLPVDSTVAAMPAKEHSNHNFHTSLIYLSALATVSGFALVITLGPNPILTIAGWAFGNPLKIGANLTSLAALGIVTGLFWLIYTQSILAQAALSYSKVRKIAGRAVKDETSMAVSRQSFLSLVGIDLQITFWLASLTVLEAGLVRYIAAVTAELPTAEPYLLAACTIIIVYYAAALIAARNLGIVYQTVTGAGAEESLKKGWELFHRHSVDVLAGMLITVVFDLLFALPAFAAWLYLKMTPGNSAIRLPATAGWLVLTALGIYMIINYTFNFWSKLYTEAASVLPPDQAAQLLGSRKAAKARPVMIAVTSAIAIVTIAAGAWQTGWFTQLPQLFQAWLVR